MPMKRAFRANGMQFYEHGHRRIAYIGSKTREAEADKFAGYEKALLDAGLELFNVNPEASDVDPDRMPELLADYLVDQRITAFFLPISVHLRPLQLSLRKRGLAIPEDLSFVGFDTAELMIDDRPVNHVAMPKVSMGERAVEQLVKMIRGEQAEEEVQCLLPCEYVRGGTVRQIE